jgi:hypothetical protein
VDGEVFLFLELVQKKTKNNGVSIFSGCHPTIEEHTIIFPQVKEGADAGFFLNRG